MNKDEDKQMLNVKNWFKDVLNLEDYSVKDIHKFIKKRSNIR